LVALEALGVAVQKLKTNSTEKQCSRGVSQGMIQKKPHDPFRVIVAVLCVIVAVASTAIIYSVQVTNLQNQINDMQQPRLVNVSLGYSDNGRGVVHVSGYVYNAGNATAYGCHVDVKLSRNGVITNSSAVYFGNDTSDTIFGGAYLSGQTATYVDANVTYAGNPPTNVTLTLGWIPPWEIPIP
jgi:hypothetical protein